MRMKIVLAAKIKTFIIFDLGEIHRHFSSNDVRKKTLFLMCVVCGRNRVSKKK